MYNICSKCGSLSSWNSYFQGYMCNTCQNVDKKNDIKERRNIRMSEETSSQSIEQEDKGYQVFSNLMDAVFDLANDLCDKKRLTKNERKLLEAMDEYCAFDEEEGENNE